MTVTGPHSGSHASRCLPLARKTETARSSRWRAVALAWDAVVSTDAHETPAADEEEPCQSRVPETPAWDDEQRGARSFVCMDGPIG